VRSEFTVVLNPGHDGGDASHPDEVNRLVPAGYGRYKACDATGTETDAGYPEHAFNWDVALRVRAILVAHGVRVIMTRHSDTGVGPCVNQRAAIGNRPGVDAVVSIHADGAPASGHGFHVNQDSRRPEGATAAVARESIALGRAIHAALVQSSGLVPSTYIGTDGYYYRDDLAGLNLAQRPATFLELGNMKNPGDAALQSSASGRQQIAAAVAAGILAFLLR
jgi:N-acetylmuramoyl-L-alanine amidase